MAYVANKRRAPLTQTNRPDEQRTNPLGLTLLKAAAVSPYGPFSPT